MFGRREESYIKHEGSFHPLFNSDDQMIGFTMSILFWSTSYNYYIIIIIKSKHIHVSAFK